MFFKFLSVQFFPRTASRRLSTQANLQTNEWKIRKINWTSPSQATSIKHGECNLQPSILTLRLRNCEKFNFGRKYLLSDSHTNTVNFWPLSLLVLQSLAQATLVWFSARVVTLSVQRKCKSNDFLASRVHYHTWEIYLNGMSFSPEIAGHLHSGNNIVGALDSNKALKLMYWQKVWSSTAYPLFVILQG